MEVTTSQKDGRYSSWCFFHSVYVLRRSVYFLQKEQLSGTTKRIVRVAWDFHFLKSTIFFKDDLLIWASMHGFDVPLSLLLCNSYIGVLLSHTGMQTCFQSPQTSTRQDLKEEIILKVVGMGGQLWCPFLMFLLEEDLGCALGKSLQRLSYSHFCTTWLTSLGGIWLFLTRKSNMIPLLPLSKDCQFALYLTYLANNQPGLKD